MKHSTSCHHSHTEVDRVLDPNFSPRDAEDRALFEAQHNYTYAVFERTMLTDMGKTFIRKFESTANAQAIYKAMVEYSQESTQASTNSSTILWYVASARIGDGSWRGTSRAFILNWMDQIWLYERSSLTPGTTSKMASNWSCSRMQSMTVSHSAMSKTPPFSWKQSVRSKQHTKSTPTYSWPKCSTIDTDLSVKSTRTPKRSVYNTDVVQQKMRRPPSMGLIALGLTVMPTPSSQMHTKHMVCMQHECLGRHGTSLLPRHRVYGTSLMMSPRHSSSVGLLNPRDRIPFPVSNQDEKDQVMVLMK